MRSPSCVLQTLTPLLGSSCLGRTWLSHDAPAAKPITKSSTEHLLVTPIPVFLVMSRLACAHLGNQGLWDLPEQMAGL